MNHEHYPDPTADKACARVDRERKEAELLIWVLKDVCASFGYEIMGDVNIRKRERQEKALF